MKSQSRRKRRNRPPVPHPLQPLTVRLDPHVVFCWKSLGSSWSTQAAEILTRYAPKVGDGKDLPMRVPKLREHRKPRRTSPRPTDGQNLSRLPMAERVARAIVKRQRMLFVLASGDILCAGEIAEKTGLQISNSNATLRWLFKMDWVKRTERFVPIGRAFMVDGWRLTPAGLERHQQITLRAEQVEGQNTV